MSVLSPIRAFFRRVGAAATQVFRPQASYRGASNGRALAGFLSSSGRETIDTLLAGTGDELRARVRVEVRENAYAGAIVETWQSEGIACGITPHCLHPDPEKARQANDAFALFAEECDPQGQNDFYAMQGLIMRAMVTDGEALVRKRYRRPGDGVELGLQLQVLEADHLPFTKNETIPGGYVLNGVEFNFLGQRQGYWLHRSHPGQRILWGNSPLDLARIPADQVLHIYRSLRPGQVRGETWLARCLQDLHLLKQYQDAELMRKKFAAFLMGFIEKAGSDHLIPTTATMAESGATAPDGAEFARLESGTLSVLNDGEKITINKPAETDPGYEAFVKSELKAIAKAALVTYHQISGDLREVNFSSIRADVTTFQRLVEMIVENTIVFQFCRPVWNAVMQQAALVGLIDAKDFTANRRAYLQCDWRLQRWKWLDPESDLKAAQGRVQAGFSSRRAEVAELGYDVSEVDRENAQDNERADELGLRYTSDGRHATAPGAKSATADESAAAAAGSRQQKQQQQQRATERVQ